MQLAVVLAACRAAGALLGRLGQPQVVADMLAGFALGPLALGLLAPAAQHALFPQPSIQTLNLLGQLGVTLFMFLVGLSFDGAGAVRHLRTATATAAASLAAPLLCGGLLGVALAGGALGQRAFTVRVGRRSVLTLTVTDDHGAHATAQRIIRAPA